MLIEVIRPFLLGPKGRQAKGKVLEVDDAFGFELVATGKAVRTTGKPPKAKPAPAPAPVVEKETQNAQL